MCLASANDDSVKQYIQQQLQKEGFDVEDFPYQRFVDYNKEHGVQLLADKASGLPSNYFKYCSYKHFLYCTINPFLSHYQIIKKKINSNMLLKFSLVLQANLFLFKPRFSMYFWVPEQGFSKLIYEINKKKVFKSLMS